MFSNFSAIFVLLFTANCFCTGFCGVVKRAATSPAPAKTSADNKQPAWVNSKKFQGDIAGYDQNSFDNLVGEIAKWQTRQERNKNNSTKDALDSAISNPAGLWTNGRVPYVFANNDPETKTAILAAMKDYHDKTCIRFVERTKEENFIKIIDDASPEKDGCWSFMGNIKTGPQELNLGAGCKSKGIALHELMHAIGFWHEQMRYDRDDFIDVFLANVKPDKTSQEQYRKVTNKEMRLIGHYDIHSVMHYTNGAFGLEGKDTMKEKNSDRKDFGGNELTQEDVNKIRELYNCADDSGGSSSIVSGATYYIKPGGTNNCLDVPGSSKDVIQLQEWGCNHTPAQQWIIDHIKDNIYSIKNVGSGNVMDVLSTEVDNEGGQVVQYPPWSPVSIHQQFMLTPRNGQFHMTAAVNGRIVWPDSNGKVRHWEYDAGQDWTLEKVN